MADFKILSSLAYLGTKTTDKLVPSLISLFLAQTGLSLPKDIKSP